MSGAHTGPRAGSRPAIALEKLHLAGGQAGMYGWMRAAAWTGAIAVFERDIVRYLERCSLVKVIDDVFVVTPAGREFLDIEPDAAPQAPLVVAGPRMAPSRNPLDLARHRPAGMRREGSLDYHNIPSLMGGQRVPHGTKITDSAGGNHK